MKFIKLGKNVLVNVDNVSFVSLTPKGESVIHFHSQSKVSASFEDTCEFLEKLSLETDSRDALKMCEEIIGTPKER